MSDKNQNNEKTSEQMPVALIICILLLAGIIAVCVILNNISVKKQPPSDYISARDNFDFEHYSYMGGYFTVITEWKDIHGYYKIAYANDTMVKYLITERQNERYAITPLYEANGDMQIYTPDRLSSENNLNKKD